MLEHLTLGDFFLTITNSRNKRLSIPEIARILTAKKTHISTNNVQLSTRCSEALLLSFFFHYEMLTPQMVCGVCARAIDTHIQI